MENKDGEEIFTVNTTNSYGLWYFGLAAQLD